MIKTRRTESDFESIEWEAYEKVLTELPFVQQVNWIKFAHDWQYMGHPKIHHKHESSSWTCPLHGGAQETAMHFWICTSDIALSRKKTHLSTLNNRLRILKTCPSLCRSMIEAISIHCGVTIDGPFVPASQSNQIQSAVAFNFMVKTIPPGGTFSISPPIPTLITTSASQILIVESFRRLKFALKKKS